MQETNFLPKRLVLCTLLLLGIYVLLLIRSELGAHSTDNGLVEATLKSKLVADYTSPDQAVVAFAPLSFALVEAKIRDENPDLPEVDVSALVETAIAAAYQPIIAATPTASQHQAAIIQSARVITELGTVLAIAQPTSTRWSTAAAHTPVPNNLSPPVPQPPTAIAVAVLLTPTAADAPATSESSTTPAQLNLSGQVANISTSVATAAPTTGVPFLLPAATNVLPVPSARPSATATFAIQQGSQSTPLPAATWTPSPSATPLPSATATTVPTPVTTNDAISSAPLSTLAAPTATGTALSFVPMTANPTATQTAPTTMLPTATNTPLPTATPLPTLLIVPTAVPSPTLTPLPTATPWPTATALPVIGTPPAVLNVTARVENDQVYLEWTPIVSPGLVGYNIYRSHSEPVGLGTIINSQLLVSTSYVDTIMRDGSKNFYVVTAVNQLHQESVPSAAVTVNMPDLIPPTTPANFALRVTGNVVQIEWQANQEADLAGYNVYRSNSLPVDRTLEPLNGTTLLPQSAYQDTVIQNGQTYYYVFTAVDWAGNESLPSIEAQIPTWRSQMP